MAAVVPSQVVGLIKQLFPDAARQVANSQAPKMRVESAAAPQVAAIVEMARRIPDHLITLEGEEFAVFITCLTVLETALKTWPTQGSTFSIVRVPGLGDDNPITLLIKLLSKCPDQHPAADVAELTFIEDDDLRFALRLDIAEANQALIDGQWKAATVLAGSVVEALLLWKLRQYPLKEIQTALQSASTPQRNLSKADPKELARWGLDLFIPIALAIKAIGPQTAKQAELAQDFRNLIHPGRSERLKQKCNRGTALSAVASVEHLIEEFSKDSKKGNGA